MAHMIPTTTSQPESRPRRLRCGIALAWAAALTVFTQMLGAEEAPAGPQGADLSNLSIEDLMSVEVTSVAKQKQTVAQSPAAVFAITQDDIRRSGLQTIPDLLRLSPGLDVAQINASHWAISSRGFNDLYANKLLVLMDGRTVYTPLFSGVYWDTLDYILPDLNHIEIIRGPGATLWGANAVDGVINITTKSAKDTQGWLFDGELSDFDQIGGIRYGGKIDDDTYYRVYTKYRGVNDFPQADGPRDFDGWQALRGGFRIDRYASSSDTFTLQGDAYNLREGQTFDFPVLRPPFTAVDKNVGNFSGFNVLGRWTHVVSDTSDVTVQLYYDRLNRADAEIGYSLDTVDLDAQQRFAWGDRQEIIYGGEYRYQADDISNRAVGTFTPNRRDTNLVSGFIQDDLAVVPNHLHFIIGTKLESNSYSNFEVQPSARILWTPNSKNSIWGAVSRAVRTPSRWEEDSRLLFGTMPTQAGLPAQLNTIGTTSFDSEKLWAYELGYRVQATPTVSIDTTAFYNSYDDLRSGTAGTPSFVPGNPPFLSVPIQLGNGLTGETYGFEVAANWNITPSWRVSGSYSFLQTMLHRGFGVDPTLEHIYEGASPRNQFQLHSYYDITKNLELNTSLYFVDNLHTGHIPAYTRVDANVTWRPKPNMDVTVGIQNAFDPQHPEFNNGLFFNRPTEVPRTVYGQLVVRF